MLSEICAEIKNYFQKEIHHGTFTISGGVIEPLSFLQNGQYFRIVGSVFNDGVYQYGIEGVAFTDETFDGAIWAMKVPPDVIKVYDKVQKWSESDAAKPSPYISESFNNYSYTKATNSSGNPFGWKDVFHSDLDSLKAKHGKARVL